jgi:hypothetical protein
MKLRTQKNEEWIEKSRDGETARFLVSPLTPKEINDGITKNTKREWDKGQRFESFDAYGYKVWKLSKVIKDWEGIENEKGEPIPCVPKMKELVYQYETDLIDEVLADAEKLAEKTEADKEEAEKN